MTGTTLNDRKSEKIELNRTFKDVSDEHEIRAWLVDQGLGHLISDHGLDSSTKNSPQRTARLDVTDNDDIRQWLNQQGLGHLVRSSSDDPQNVQLPVHYPELITDDFQQYTTSNGQQMDQFDPKRTRSLSAGMSFPSEFYNNGYDFGSSEMQSSNAVNGSREGRLYSHGGGISSASPIMTGDPNKIVVREVYKHYSDDFFDQRRQMSPERMFGYPKDMQGNQSRTRPRIRRHRSQPILVLESDDKRQDRHHNSRSSSRSTSGAQSSDSNEIIKITAPYDREIGQRYPKKEEYDEHGNLVHKQRVFVRYLQPPTPPADGPIIIKETPIHTKNCPSPIIIRQTYPSPPTPLPIVYREQAPPRPRPEPTTIINKRVPIPSHPRQIIIEKVPPPPRKHPDIIIEKWLPPKPSKQRKVIIHQCEPRKVATPVITVVDPSPCKSNLKYIKRVYDESCPQVMQSSPSNCTSVMTCIPAGCMNPSTIICQQGQPGVIIPAVVAPGGFCAQGVYGQTIPNQSGPPLPSGYPNLNQIGHQYIPQERDAVQNAWRALQASPTGGGPTQQTRTGMHDIGSEYLPREGDAVRGIWNALQASSPGGGGGTGQRPRGSTQGIGSEYLPREGDAVRGIWNALRASPTDAGPTQQTRSGMQGLGSEYLPREGDAVRGIWNALQDTPRNPPFSASQMGQIGQQYLPSQTDAVNEAWNAMRRPNMPFTGLLESYVRKRFQGVR